MVVSALIQRNYPYFIVYNYVFDNLVEVCISKVLFEEYLEVLNRPKFRKYPDFTSKAELVLTQIEAKSLKFKPTQRVNIIQDDADNRLLELELELELALASKADFIITGNTNDFTMSHFQGTKIVSPKEYWDFFRE